MRTPKALTVPIYQQARSIRAYSGCIAEYRSVLEYAPYDQNTAAPPMWHPSPLRMLLRNTFLHEANKRQFAQYQLCKRLSVESN